ncbi:ribonuclease P protein component [Mycobacterium spongiae]|uniref:Ribonuclease P protein component n=1 Tax=Mycobacterium spongiae TaxID=886343 RepID=A0A975K166_9MYCO|nr:ribonuclease P protein component [Mycobacterium spongiae]QUR69486.1 ribonuclease P protein component [Mycobacterium spongiae]
MLSARNRMRRSTDFDMTVKRGRRTVQPNLIVHALPGSDCDVRTGPRIGLIVAKSVGSAVERHRVARRLRHVARSIVSELHESDRVVIRARPSSRGVSSPRLEQQLRAGLRGRLESAGTGR